MSILNNSFYTKQNPVFTGLKFGFGSTSDTGVDPVVFNIGEFMHGGYFTGYYSMNGDGVATHGLIVAPKIGGESYDIFSGTNYSEDDSRSDYDGATNTANADLLNNSPAFEFCADLTLNGYSDWYLPSVLELQLAYLNLKPTTDLNASNAYDSNSYAVPQFDNAWSSTFPAQTDVLTFQDGGSNDFDISSGGATKYYWTSTVSANNAAYCFDFQYGTRPNIVKSGYDHFIRAFRKVPVGSL